MLKSYEVLHSTNGHSFGVYFGATADAAIDACVQDAGYASRQDMASRIGQELQMTASRVAIVVADPDADDCLQAAEEHYKTAHGLKGWDLSPRWQNGDRVTVVLTIPEHA